MVRADFEFWQHRLLAPLRPLLPHLLRLAVKLGPCDFCATIFGCLRRAGSSVGALGSLWV